MSDLTSLTGKPLKHYAQDLITRQRYIVIALANDDDANMCSVIDMDALDSDTRAELVNYVNSDECQSCPEIWKLLDRKLFNGYPNESMLSVLKKMRQILKVKSAQVAIQLPGDKTMTPREVLDCIEKYEKDKKRGIGSFNADTLEVSKVENKNAEEIDSLKKDIANMNTQITSLATSISDLVKALKPTKEKK